MAESSTAATVAPTKNVGSFTPSGPVVSIFDFDGTLFRSPEPSAELLKQYPSASQPYENKGLAWFHNRRSLHPPYVPDAIQHFNTSLFFGGGGGSKETSTVTKDIQTGSSTKDQEPEMSKTTMATSLLADAHTYQDRYHAHSQRMLRVPSEAAANHPADGFDKWFIAPTVAAYMDAKANNHVTAILTGRETSFTDRLAALIHNAGLTFDHVYLKHKPGTIKFKIDVFIELIKKYEPKMVIYYEDRPDQGAKIRQGFFAQLPKELEAERAAYYSSPQAFAVVLVPKEVSSAPLPAELESQLLAELLEDAKTLGISNSAGSNRGRGGGSKANRDTEKAARKK